VEAQYLSGGPLVDSERRASRMEEMLVPMASLVALQKTKVLSPEARGTCMIVVEQEVPEKALALPVLNDRWKSLSLNDIYSLTIRDDSFEPGVDLFRIPVGGSLSKPKDNKDTYNNCSNASNCAAYGWCNNRAAFRYDSEIRLLRRVWDILMSGKN
jgi:hypothetical protein